MYRSEVRPKANIQSYKILMNICFLRQWAIMIIVYDKTTEVWKKRWRTWAMKTLWSECDIKKSSGSAETWLLIFATQEAPNHNELFQYTTCCTVNTIKKKKIDHIQNWLTFICNSASLFSNEQSFSFSFNAHIHYS